MNAPTVSAPENRTVGDIGEKEISEGTLAVRDRATDQTTSMSMEELLAKLEKEISERI